MGTALLLIRLVVRLLRHKPSKQMSSSYHNFYHHTTRQSPAVPRPKRVPSSPSSPTILVWGLAMALGCSLGLLVIQHWMLVRQSHPLVDSYTSRRREFITNTPGMIQDETQTNHKSSPSMHIRPATTRSASSSPEGNRTTQSDNTAPSASIHGQGRRQTLEWHRIHRTTTPLAWQIVTTAFDETYRHLQTCLEQPQQQQAANPETVSQPSPTTNASTSSSNNKKDEDANRFEYEECLRHLRERGTSSTRALWPWWFQTLMRDASPYSDLHAGFHDLWIRLSNSNDNHDVTKNQSDQLLRFCAIEKVSSSRWRRLQCELNDPDYFQPTNGTTTTTKNMNTTRRTKQCYLSLSSSTTNATRRRVTRAVLLRDPLERFLSAFVDKCTGATRFQAHHCQPNLLFGASTDQVQWYEHHASGRTNLLPPPLMNKTRTTKTKTKQKSEPLQPPNVKQYNQHHRAITGDLDFNNAKHAMWFQFYVDVFPMSWNVHFYPQALYCQGLFRNLWTDYDFVGTYHDGRELKSMHSDGNSI